jgi:hypothetical protein
MNAPKGKIKAVAVVRDRYGRIVVDDQVFHDKDKLELLRQEVLKNGSHPFGSNP